ncbi:MAG: LptF/LptG family permease [Campylobacterota bacterium]|nr:LptF/LptG family permease [Campylobacterota bacterium]
MYPKLYFYYLSRAYLKNFIFILLGLTLAFATVNYFQNASSIKGGFNNQLLYSYYVAQEALDILYPLALIFGAIMTKLDLVKNNTLGILYSFGYSKRNIIAPFLLIAFIVHLLFVYLNTTTFAYANDNADTMKRGGVEHFTKEHLFFKYNDSFVYLRELDPIAKKIYDIDIFNLEGDRLISTIHAQSATFNGTLWEAEHITIKEHIYQGDTLQRFETTQQDRLNTLEGYKPQMIDQIYEGKNINIIDAYSGFELLDSQGLDSYKMRAALYSKLFFPLFALFLIIVIFFKIPPYARFMNLAVTLAASLGIVFLVWGLLFAFNQIGASGTVIPELTTLLPIILLAIYALNIYSKIDRRI